MLTRTQFPHLWPWQVSFGAEVEVDQCLHASAAHTTLYCCTMTEPLKLQHTHAGTIKTPCFPLTLKKCRYIVLKLVNAFSRITASPDIFLKGLSSNNDPENSSLPDVNQRFLSRIKTREPGGSHQNLQPFTLSNLSSRWRQAHLPKSEKSEEQPGLHRFVLHRSDKNPLHCVLHSWDSTLTASTVHWRSRIFVSSGRV